MPYLSILAAALATVAGFAADTPQAEDDGWAVVQRSKSTQATYAAYQWNVVLDQEGNPFAEWAAEFHSGDMHRLEVARLRIVANCRTHQGYVFDVKTGETQDSDTVWLGACGIDTEDQIIGIDRLESIPGKNGPLDVIRIRAKTDLRYYAVDRAGVIIRSNRAAANGSPAPCLQNVSIAILPNLPARDMFTRASLARSFVADRYRQSPKGPPPAGLGGTHCG